MKVVVGAATALLLLTGCAAFNSDDESGSTGELDVVAAFYPLQYVAERVGGDLVTVENITSPGTEPHDLELSIQESAEVAGADLVIYQTGFQPAVDDAVEENATGARLDVADAVELTPATEHADEEHADEHDHGDTDPHFWQDPLLLADLGDAVGAELAQLDPDHATEYEEATAALRNDLEALDAEYEAGLDECDRHTVVVSHDAFGYLTRYGLEFEPIAGLSPDAEPTPAVLGRLQALIEELGITTVFGERLVSADLTETLAEDLGIKTAVLDPIEGLTDQTEDEDYLSLVRENLVALEDANGCR